MRTSEPLLDRFLPDWRLRQVDRITVAARPRKAWAAVRSLDFYALGSVRFLFNLRTLPDRLLGRGAPQPPRMTLEDLDDHPEPGFRILGETRGREVAFGAIGKVWKLKIPFQEVPIRSWSRFSEPGYCKVAWSLGVEPAPERGSYVQVDVRVTATDDASWRKFQLYWSLIGPFSHMIRKATLARFRKELGELPGPLDESVPLTGDGILPDARAQATQSRVVEAPPTRVWPWLVQMGCRRAGWYSYDRLDNGGIPSAERILPEFQKVKVGDLLPATPKDMGGFAVLALKPGKGFVLGSPELLPERSRKTSWGLPYHSTWQFGLEPIGRGACRLYTRVRASYRPGLRMALFKPLILLIHHFMQEKQLDNLKKRCETAS